MGGQIKIKQKMKFYWNQEKNKCLKKKRKNWWQILLEKKFLKKSSKV